MNPRIESLEKLLGGPRDSALLRFSLGSEYLKAGDPERAAAYLANATALNPHHTAAWKLLGKARSGAADFAGAAAAYTAGIAAAEAHGDIQAIKEMRVFLRRLQRT